MSVNNVELARLWIEKAENDLVSASHLIKLVDGPLDNVCFHAQQVVEKSIKGLLIIHQVEFTKTHNLVLLLDRCLPFILDLDDYREQFAEMTAYAVEIRYPRDFFTPSKDEAKSALDIAEEVLAIVRKQFAGKTGENE